MLKNVVLSAVEWGVSITLLAIPLVVLVLTVLKFVQEP